MHRGRAMASAKVTELGRGPERQLPAPGLHRARRCLRSSSRSAQKAGRLPRPRPCSAVLESCVPEERCPRLPSPVPSAQCTRV